MQTRSSQHLSAASSSRPHRATMPAGGWQVQEAVIAAMPSRQKRQRRGRVAVVAAATAALAAAGVTKWSALAASVALLGHVRWMWPAAAVVLELASLAALAAMQRRLLEAGGASVRARPMLAIMFAANALSVSVPLAGPELGTLFTFRRLTRKGADTALASWSLLAGGLVSTATGALVVAGGGLSSGNIVAVAAAAPVGLLAVAALVLVAVAAHQPRLRGALERSAAWALRHGGRLLPRMTDDPGQTVRAWAGRAGSFHLPASGWVTVTALALANWLTDAAVLAVSIHAAGVAVPWRVLLLIYGSGVAAQGLAITPGGLGVAEGTLGLALVAAGLRPGPALAAVLLYRLVSFWLVASVGWLVFLLLRRHRVPEDASPARQFPRPRSVPAVVTAIDPPGRPQARALVFLHGQPGSGADWQQVTRRLPAHWQVVVADRPGYGSNPRPGGGFAANARDVFDQMDSRGIQRAVLVGHSYGGGVALAAASRAPHRVEAVVLLASVGPGCVNAWDRLMAAPGTGPLCALIAWRLTPWIARARLARLTRRKGRPLGPGEHVNWQVWAHVCRDRDRLWRTFLAEQRALVRELAQLAAALPSVQVPVLVLTDPTDRLVPIGTASHLAKVLPAAQFQLVEGAGHHLPRRAPDVVADALAAFLAAQATRASCSGVEVHAVAKV